MSELYDILVETPPTKVILLALDQGLWDCERSPNELAALCEANHIEAVAQISQKRQTPETGIVLGSGKLEEASLAAQELGAECAVFDGELTGSQIRNISTALGGMEVIDRTMLILEIFHSRAVTNEGKLQTELALLRYRLPRLQGMGESLSRQGGGGGGGGGARRGAGETKLELDRRHVHARIDALAEKLAEMEKRRGESRKARAKTGMPVVSLVGYTNVGKSSLMNALCGPSVAEADMLFATLDPTSRKLVLPSGMAVLLVDTVGFVSRLPHNLVEAFKSTLEEAAWSDVIVRVADAGDDQREEQLAVTDEVLDGLAYSANKPLVPVHHLRGHIAALYLTHPELKPPFLCLVASGGHSHIVEVQDYTHYHILGHTVDDAAGEAFDKVARTLGLPYPGGPSVANAAKTGDPKAYRLPVPHVDGKYNVSFSGLKTAVLNEVNKAQMKNEEINVPDLAASFQERIAGILAEKLLLAAADTGAKQVCLAGGVAANGRLRQLVNDGAQKLGAKVYLPELKFCGDNGAMIAAQGYYQYMAGHTAGLDLNGLPTLPIDYE